MTTTPTTATPQPPATENGRSAPVTVGNLLVDYFDRLPAVIERLVPDPEPVTEPGAFTPGFALPALDERTREFLSVAEAAWAPLPDYRGHRLSLLDLARNPGTHTTKTFASLLIVARAVEFVRRSGEPVVLFTPTSANKGTALRDAVDRAYRAGLATPDQLRLAVLAPASCRGKLRANGLSDDPDLAARNPMLVYEGDQPEDVKAIGREFVGRYAAELHRRSGAHLWFSLELTNYMVADAARAFFERDAAPPDRRGPRLHAHAVSSAYGLLGYSAGRDALEAAGVAEEADRPAFLLVQHLGTPEMVLSAHFGDFDRSRLPAYRWDAGDGLYRQHTDPRFPAATLDPAEVLDPTFYSHRPPTTTAMNALIERSGGGGIVVSLHECLQRYPHLRALLADSGRTLPADPRTLREWSLVMALTGVCGAIDRELVPAGRDIVVHGSGSYATTDFRPLDRCDVRAVRTVEDVAAAVLP
jgi:hypothetical protein